MTRVLAVQPPPEESHDDSTRIQVGEVASLGDAVLDIAAGGASVRLNRFVEVAQRIRLCDLVDVNAARSADSVGPSAATSPPRPGR